MDCAGYLWKETKIFQWIVIKVLWRTSFKDLPPVPNELEGCI